MQAYFDQLDRVRYEGSKSSNPLAFRHYNPDELVLGKRMEEHLRFAACYWHTFCWNGADMFGVGAFNRPWQQPGEALALAKRKADVAFEFFHKLHVPFYCFHDVDVSPEGASLKSTSIILRKWLMSRRQARRERREAAVGNRQLLYKPSLRRGCGDEPRS